MTSNCKNIEYHTGHKAMANRLDFKIFKNGNKFLVSVIYNPKKDECQIKAAFNGEICPDIWCKPDDVQHEIDNIDVNFSKAIKRHDDFTKMKANGPVIYGEGHGTGIILSCDCCVQSESMEFYVRDINMPPGADNRLVSRCYV